MSNDQLLMLPIRTHFHITLLRCDDLRSCRRLLHNGCSRLSHEPGRRLLWLLLCRWHHQSHGRAVQLTQLLWTNLPLGRRGRHDELLARVRRQEALCLRTLRSNHHPLGCAYKSTHVLDLQQRVVRCHHQSSGRRHDELMLTNQVNRLQDSLSIGQQDLLMGCLSPVRGEHPLRLCRLSTIRQNRQLRNSRTNLETL